LFLLLALRLPPPSTLFPYTTLFRSLVQFLNGGIAPDFLDKGTDFAFLGISPALHHRQVMQTLLVGFLLLFQRRRQLHKPLLGQEDRKSTRLNSSHVSISYAVFCLTK